MALHDRVATGDRLRIRAPRNEFPLVSPAVHSILLGGGIGVVPLIAMAESLWVQGSPFELHYSARNKEHAPFVEALGQRPYSSRVRFHCTEAVGHLNFAELLRRLPSSSEVYICGPVGFMQSAATEFIASGRSSLHMHLESFASNANPWHIRRW